MNSTLPEPIASAGFTLEQKEYLTGLFAGVAARGQGLAARVYRCKLDGCEPSWESVDRTALLRVHGFLGMGSGA